MIFTPSRTNVTPTWLIGRCVTVTGRLPGRTVHAEGWYGGGHRVTRLIMIALLTLLAAACSPTADSSADVSSSPGASPAIASPTDAQSAPATPQQAALAAYRDYLDASVDALADRDADAGSLESTSDGAALRLARRRVRANRRDGVAVTGVLEPSATAADVQIDAGQDGASVGDCVLNGLEQVSAQDPDEVINKATGWRQPVRAELRRRGAGWIVTSVDVPLKDGSGNVPPPPDDPPFLRGPAQGPAPPSCVPDPIAEDAAAAVVAFHDALNSALGLGRTGPADPDRTALADVAAEPQLSTAVDFLAKLADQDQAFRGEPSSHDPWAVSTLEFDTAVIVYDCVTVGANGLADADAGEPASENPDAGSYRLDGVDLVLDDGDWKVAGISVIEEGLDECTSSAQ